MDADVVVVGGGAVGASTALHLARRGLRTLALEKEVGPGLHQSGRNSGVIHPGYNAKPGTLKARFCVEGSQELRSFCRDHGVAVEEGGILVVARTEDERRVLIELHRRAGENGARTRLLDERALQEVEPHARGVEALHAPEGASFDAPAYVHKLVEQAQQAGARFRFATRALRLEETVHGVHVETSHGILTAKAAVNCAGLHADRLARDLAHDMRVVPFRGYYAELRPDRRSLVRSHVYGAPDLAFPFLGVHLSKRTDGRVIVGPGAMLAFGREAYRFSQFNLRDLKDTLLWPGFYRLFRKPAFRRLVGSETRKSLSLAAIAREARDLVPGLTARDLVRSYAGNRAQLVSREGATVEDIVVRTTDRAVHVLNAVSPGLTCSLPFGRHVANQAVQMAS